MATQGAVMRLLARGGAAATVAVVGRTGRIAYAGTTGMRATSCGSYCCWLGARSMVVMVGRGGSLMRWYSGGGGGGGRGGQRRGEEEEDGGVKKWEFEDVLNAVKLLDSSAKTTPTPTPTFLDVREPHEFNSNSIPTAHNLPVVSHPHALFLPADEFRQRFAFPKPALDQEVVFFCKAGVRSKAAVAFARQAGYTNIGEYSGSWNDWVSKRGPMTKKSSSSGEVGEIKASSSETCQTSKMGSRGEEDSGQREGM